LAALAWTGAEAWRPSSIDRVRENTELCAIYWHFLLFIWFALFAMLTGWTNELGVICRRILS